jgi:hypothetical protein
VKRKATNPHRPQLFVVGVDMFKVDVGVAVNLKERDVMKRLRALCSNEAQLAEVKSEMDGWDNNANMEGQLCHMGGGFVVLLRTIDKPFHKVASLVAHEMVHTTQYLLRNRRVPLNEDTEEVHAYLTEHLVEETLARLYQ